MARTSVYKQINKFLHEESLEPTLAWGFRMALAGSVPLLWGLYTGHLQAAMFITLTAEGICWVELKGTFSQRLRTLLRGTFLTVLFGILGTVTAPYPWLSIAAMAVVAFISSLFKNLGDRGSGLAICVYLLFIFCNAYPLNKPGEIEQRILFVVAGAAWTAMIGALTSSLMPALQPYRRSLGLIWRNIDSLITTVKSGWDGRGQRSGIRDIYNKEKEIRSSIDASLSFHEQMAHQVSSEDKAEYNLAQFRKSSALVAAHIINISEEAESINLRTLDGSLRMQLASLLNVLQQTAERMSVYVVSLRPEEKVLLTSRLSRLHKLLRLLRTNETTDPNIRRCIHLADRATRLIENCLRHLDELGTDQPVFRSYSLIKTLFTLHPKFWLQNLRLLFNFNTFTTRYALRAALAATIAMFIYKYFDIPRGYWLPFSVIIVLQPYFGATIKKSLDRILGTIAGSLLGGFLLLVHTGIYLNEILLCLSFVFMIYFLRRNYAMAVFIITINLVLLFNLEEGLDTSVLITRVLATAGGCLLAIVAGFAFLPHWDKKWLPVHLAKAIHCNYNYFIDTFYTRDTHLSWTKLKRSAETNNSNVFDSFNRYMAEPSVKKKHYANYYQLITHNVRITRELNNIHLETESRSPSDTTSDPAALILECHTWFDKIIHMLNALDEDIEINTHYLHSERAGLTQLTEAQVLYLNKLLIDLKEMFYDLEKLAEKAYVINVA